MNQNISRSNSGEMVRAEFLAELAETREMLEWYITGQKRIRARLKAGGSVIDFDPISAVAHRKTGEFFPEGQWRQAADAIGLSYEDCADIVAAFNYDWDPGCRQGNLRHKLMHMLLLPQEDSRPFSLTELLLPNYRKRSVSTRGNV